MFIIKLYYLVPQLFSPQLLVAKKVSANVGCWSRGRGGTWRAGVNPWPAPKPLAKFSPFISRVLSPAWGICCSIRVPPAPHISCRTNRGSSSVHLSLLQSGVTPWSPLQPWPCPFSPHFLGKGLDSTQQSGC